MHILTAYSLILTNTVFHVTNGLSTAVDSCSAMEAEDSFAMEDLTTIFTTSAPGIWYRNVTAILSRCFKRAFPRMTEQLIEFHTEFQGGTICIDFIATKPSRGRKAILAPRCF